MTRRRVSFIVHDLAAHPIVRAAALAAAVARTHDVEVIQNNAIDAPSIRAWMMQKRDTHRRAEHTLRRPRRRRLESAQ